MAVSHEKEKLERRHPKKLAESLKRLRILYQDFEGTRFLGEVNGISHICETRLTRHARSVGLNPPKVAMGWLATPFSPCDVGEEPAITLRYLLRGMLRSGIKILFLRSDRQAPCNSLGNTLLECYTVLSYVKKYSQSFAVPPKI
jgi:hypothetical protein